MSAKSKTFEASMERLETIVRQLEQGNVPLEESLKLFQEGTGACPVLYKAAGRRGNRDRETDENRRRYTGRNGVCTR